MIYKIQTNTQVINVYEYEIVANSKEEALVKLEERIKTDPFSCNTSYSYTVDNTEVIDFENVSTVSSCSHCNRELVVDPDWTQDDIDGECPCALDRGEAAWNERADRQEDDRDNKEYK